MIDLSNKRALVTGAGTGIGAAIARTLADCGADVVVHYANNKDGADEVVAHVEGAGRRGLALRADLTSSEAATEMVAEAVDFLGGLDILVNNSGHLVGRATIAEMSDEHWAKVWAVNVSSTFFTTRAAIPHLRESEAGRVVLMSSLAAQNGGGAGSVAYAAAKASIVGFGRGLAKELAPAKVTVNMLAPGFIQSTPFHDTFTPKDAQTNIIGGVPLGRGGTVQDVADVTAFLASGLSGYVTGQVVDINGGVHFT